MLAPIDDRFPSLVRGRLSAAIARSAAENPVVVLAAPTGYGKTIAIRDFVDATFDNVARIDLGAGPVSLEAFARTFGAALGIEGVDPQLVCVRLGERADRLPQAIVLDDFGAYADDARIVEFVESAVRRTRGRTAWIVASRGALPLSRWYADGFVDEPIDERELRFDSTEVDALAHLLGVPSNEIVAPLIAATDGWPHAVARGLHALRSGESPAEVLAATRERMNRFFADRVIAQRSLAERRFFFDTCVFDDITPDILEAYGSDAASTMAAVRAATSFVSYGSNGAFRYHPAFRDFLRARLRLEGPAAYERATARAFRALAAVGRDADCIRLAMRGGTRMLVETLWERGSRSIDRGEFALLRDALAALPATQRESDPDMMHLLANVGGAFPPDFETTYRRMLVAEPSATRRATFALGLASRFGRTGRLDAAIDVLADIDPAAVDDASVRARLLSESAALVARSRRAGGVPSQGAAIDVRQRIDAALALAASRPDDVLASALVHRDAAQVALADERAGDALRFAGFAIDAAAQAGAPRIELRAHALRYRAMLDLGRSDGAQAHLTTIRTRAALADDVEMSLFALAAASDIAADAGDETWLDDLDRALEAVGPAALETFVESLDARLGDALARSRALRRAWDGRFIEALRELDRVADAIPARLVTAAEAAVYAAASGDLGRARGECSRIRADLEAARNPTAPSAVLARLLVAVASIVIGDDQAFVADVTELESIANRLGLPHICFVRALRTMHDYAGNRASRGAMHAETETLAAQGLGGYATLLALLPIHPTVVVPTSGLTAGEIRVLELLCDGLTSREIAARLGRSVLTIDSHVKMIVKKLQCTNGRREAVAMARTGRIAGLPARLNILVG